MPGASGVEVRAVGVQRPWLSRSGRVPSDRRSRTGRGSAATRGALRGEAIPRTPTKAGALTVPMSQCGSAWSRVRSANKEKAVQRGGKNLDAHH